MNKFFEGGLRKSATVKEMADIVKKISRKNFNGLPLKTLEALKVPKGVDDVDIITNIINQIKSSKGGVSHALQRSLNDPLYLKRLKGWHTLNKSYSNLSGVDAFKKFFSTGYGIPESVLKKGKLNLLERIGNSIGSKELYEAAERAKWLIK